MTKINYKKHFTELDKNGYTLIPDVLSLKLCDQISDKLDKIYEKRRQAGLNNYSGLDVNQEKMVFNLHNKDDIFLQLIDHPVVIPILERQMEDTVVLNYFNGRSPVQGCKSQRLHLDSRIPIPTATMMMQVIWMINDFTKENGGTRVVPGSHKRNAKPDPAVTYPDERQITGKAGSVFMYNSGVWHGASACTVPGTRWGVIATYARWFIKPSMDFTKNTPQAVYKRLNLRQKQFLGFNSVPPHDESQRIHTITSAGSIPKNLPKNF